MELKMKNQMKDLNLVDYLTGNLSEDEKTNLEKELETNEELRLELSLMRRELNLMRDAAHDPLAEVRISAIHENVMGEIRQRERAPVLFNTTWLSYFRAVAIVLVLVVALTIFFLAKPFSSPNTDDGLNGLQAEAPQNTPDNQRQPLTLRISTSNPKIKIQWTVDPDFPELD
jgi:anti-sigma-K factor RskA